MTGEELLILRRRRKLTQAELARRAGVTPGQISRLETGQSKITSLREEQLRRLLAPVGEEPPAEIPASYGT